MVKTGGIITEVYLLRPVVSTVAKGRDNCINFVSFCNIYIILEVNILIIKQLWNLKSALFWEYYHVFLALKITNDNHKPKW